MRDSRLSLIFLAGLGLFLGALASTQACFLPPSGDVLFACVPDDPDGRDACPEGYSCEADGCCHKDGSDVEANFGDCAVGGASQDGDTGTEGDAGTEAESESSSDTTDTTTDSSEADTDTGTETDTGTDTSSDTGTDADTGTETDSTGG